MTDVRISTKNLSIPAVSVESTSKDNFKEALFVQRLAVFNVPFAFFVIPFIVFNYLRENVIFGIFLMSFSLANFIVLISWINYNFIFSVESVKLPGRLCTWIPYSRIKEIYRRKDYPLMMSVLYTVENSLLQMTRSKKQEILHWYAARDAVDAQIIWSQFLEHLEKDATKVTEDSILMGTED